MAPRDLGRHCRDGRLVRDVGGDKMGRHVAVTGASGGLLDGAARLHAGRGVDVDDDERQAAAAAAAAAAVAACRCCAFAAAICCSCLLIRWLLLISRMLRLLVLLYKCQGGGSTYSSSTARYQDHLHDDRCFLIATLSES